MKKTLILILFLLVSREIQAQRMVLKTYLEKTHDGYKIGSALGHETFWKIEYGAFYQKATDTKKNEAQIHIETADQFENEFAGIYAAIPLKHLNKMDFKIQVRSGVINREDFVATPSLLANYIPAKQMILGLGVGFREMTPTILASFSLSF